MLSSRQLLDAARDMLTRHHADPAIAKLSVRAAAVLGRQALETHLAVSMGGRYPGIQDCPFRSQLLCLQIALDDKELAEEVAHAWSALSGACHHRLYDLAPVAQELTPWLGTVARFIDVPLDPPTPRAMAVAGSHP